ARPRRARVWAEVERRGESVGGGPGRGGVGGGPGAGARVRGGKLAEGARRAGGITEGLVEGRSFRGRRAQLFGGALLISGRGPTSPLATARSPMQTMPTGRCSASTTGS